MSNNSMFHHCCCSVQSDHEAACGCGCVGLLYILKGKQKIFFSPLLDTAWFVQVSDRNLTDQIKHNTYNFILQLNKRTCN